jgi:hypothetical protein
MTILGVNPVWIWVGCFAVGFVVWIGCEARKSFLR